MNNLAALPGAALDYYDAIVASKRNPRRERLVATRPVVQIAYVEYATHVGDLAILDSVVLTDEQKSDFQHCYVIPTQPLNELKADIAEHHVNVCGAAAALCQYCGLNHDASDFDHYLPKELFAEFSTLTLNLVPCCGRCNELKGTSWLNADGTRRIVSFYFDGLPQQQFLFADVELNQTPLAEFRLTDDPAPFGGLEATIRSHFEKLELLPRFSKAAPEQFSDVRVEIRDVVRTQGTVAAATLLSAKAAATAQSHSPNYWKVALLQAMAASQDFLTFCGE